MKALQSQKEVLEALRSSCQATEKFWKIWHNQYLDDCQCEAAESKVNCHCSDFQLEDEFTSVVNKLPVKTPSWELNRLAFAMDITEPFIWRRKYYKLYAADDDQELTIDPECVLSDISDMLANIEEHYEFRLNDLREIREKTANNENHFRVQVLKKLDELKMMIALPDASSTTPRVTTTSEIVFSRAEDFDDGQSIQGTEPPHETPLQAILRVQDGRLAREGVAQAAPSLDTQEIERPVIAPSLDTQETERQMIAPSLDTQETERQAIAECRPVVLVDKNDEESEDGLVVIDETHSGNESPEPQQEAPPPPQEGLLVRVKAERQHQGSSIQGYVRRVRFQVPSDRAQVAEAGRPLLRQGNDACRPEQPLAQRVAAEETIPGRERGEDLEHLREELRRNIEALDELRNMTDETRRESVCEPRVYDVPIENYFFRKMPCVFCGMIGVHYSDSCTSIRTSKERSQILARDHRCRICMTTECSGDSQTCKKRDRRCNHRKTGHNSAICPTPERSATKQERLTILQRAFNEAEDNIAQLRNRLGLQ
ncbi:unnamed protein product [Heligmosomoides polygyrus]|uniref:CCHC-type domain-containing protein n=1 Tax=Heligmosomoides polygyrus TaxID=6339 RepID=A0A183G6M3_HELPZ|nr:unnamed protein product [Heligmosomoides polygyrus]